MNNKIIVIGIVFILLFTINLTLNNSHASLNAIYQVPIILVNDENVSTPNPFQQMIQLNESNYKGYMIYNGSFANFEFVYGNGTVIPSWIENNNSGKLIIWLKINSIPASSSETIYLDIFSLNDNLLNASGKNGIGEAPQLSPTYAKYDDGINMFNFYDNFVGTRLNSSKWTVYGVNYTVNNSLYSTGSPNPGYIIANYNIYPGDVIMFYGLFSGFNNIGTGKNNFQGTFFQIFNYFAHGQEQFNNSGATTAINVNVSTTTLYEIDIINSQTSYYYISNSKYGNNYYLGSAIANDSSYPYPLSALATNGRQSFNTYQMYYILVRNLPPNGIMPSVTIGSLTPITKFPKSEEMNIHARIYALNLSLPQEWGIYGFFNYSIYGKNYSISISNLTNNYYLNLSINYNFSIFNNTTLSYNLSLFAYKLQNYIAINHLNYKGRLNVTTTQREYNITLNDSIIKSYVIFSLSNCNITFNY